MKQIQNKPDTQIIEKNLALLNNLFQPSPKEIHLNLSDYRKKPSEPRLPIKPAFNPPQLEFQTPQVRNSTALNKSKTSTTLTASVIRPQSEQKKNQTRWLQMNVQERNEEWIKMRSEKRQNLKDRMDEAEMEKCTFQPRLNENGIGYIYNVRIVLKQSYLSSNKLATNKSIKQSQTVQSESSFYQQLRRAGNSYCTLQSLKRQAEGNNLLLQKNFYTQDKLHSLT